ncbi:MAG TPA: trypsin-like peptidase domain-containing protein, partial [Planctomycetaceae bacterium]|nr:trypsin-like peptidase domain-containing protein [Planctomycetaceae bacterium]
MTTMKRGTVHFCATLSWLIAWMSCGSASQLSGQEVQELSLADLIERSEPACVRIDVKYKDGNSGIGSGFVVDTERKWVVTNYHVVGDSVSATVIFPDGVEASVEGWRAHYTDFDLALLQIKTNKKLSALKVAQKLPRKGESAVAIGAPSGLSFTASEGIVSGIRKGEELKQFGPKLKGTWLQTSTPISPGSSGGPLLNRSGEVLGVNSATLAGAQNLNFAISCDQINQLVRVGQKIRLRKLSELTPMSEAGSVPRGGASNDPESIVIKIPSQRRFRHRYDIEEDE